MTTDVATCSYCGRELDRGKADAFPVLDHAIPRSRGGTDDATNLVLACWECNTNKGASTPEEFIARGLRGVGEWRRSAPCTTCGADPGAPCTGRRGPWRYNLHPGRQP